MRKVVIIFQWNEDIPHILLICEEYLHIRSQFLTQVTFLNPGIISFSNNTDILLISILDPESTKLPVEIRDSWKDIDSMYEKSRQFCWNIHRKREKILQSKDIQVSTGWRDFLAKMLTYLADSWSKIPLIQPISHPSILYLQLLCFVYNTSYVWPWLLQHCSMFGGNADALTIVQNEIDR